MGLVAEAKLLDNLEILQAGQDLMLDFELNLHAVLGAFLDGEWLGLECFELTRVTEIDDDVWAAVDLEIVTSCFIGLH